jgi:zinc transporter 9
MIKTKNRKTAGYLPVMAAILGNFFITCIKFLAFFISGSGALFSEAVHSLADVSNQALLMVGIKRSTKEADDEFLYGYGRERFFWAVISACSIFFVGSGITVTHGVLSFMHPAAVHISGIVFYVLITSFIIEAFTFWLAWRELKVSFAEDGVFKILKYGDPSTIAVLYEDGVAVIGVLIALTSVMLTKLTGELYWDSIGSVVIGLLLGFMALVLINKNRSYLIGRSMPVDMSEKIIAILSRDPMIEKVLDFKSMTLDVNKYRIKCEIEFNSTLFIKEAFKKGLRDEYENVKDDFEEFKKFLVEHTDRIPRLMGSKIDELEKKVTRSVLEVKHIDIEIN